ncbi:MAG: hypothetical protein IJU08_04900 [Bacteroidales bacterium]|nr:hypothetical protein [Bacteroidales bacterium]
MKTRALQCIIAAVSLLTLFSCSDNIEPQVTPVEQTSQAGTYTMTVVAGRGEIGTKALNLSGNTLNASWKAGEKVKVINTTQGNAELGTLTAQKGGTTTTLSGPISDPISADDVLLLEFLSPNYDSQVGTLAYIEENCDYATAEVTVKGITDGNITTDAASFTNRQAIVKFTLRNNSDSEYISALSLTFSVGGKDITVTPPEAAYEMFVAIPAISDNPITLLATTASGPKGYTRSGVTFEQGRYYDIKVRMSNATIVHNDEELNTANKDGAYIIFANDIARESEALSISGNITIDLAGHSLSRELGSTVTKGCVIIVSNTGDLTLTGGTVTGGRITEGGGGMINYGTATVRNCTFSDNTAITRGGAIWSSGSLTVDNSSFTGNEALAEGGEDHNEGDGGALHFESGTATLTDVTITNNTSKDAGGIYVKSGATLNLGGTSAISGNSSTEHGGGGIVNYGTVKLSGTVSITENTCHTNGAGIWSNGTLSMEGNISVKGNTGDDIYLKKGKVITTGALTGGNESIGVNMEVLDVFTSGYEANNAGNTNHFFPSGTVNGMGLTEQGEGKMLYFYIDATWDYSFIQTAVIQTERLVNEKVNVLDICSSMFASGGDLYASNWYVASGTGSTTHGLTCKSGRINLILCDDASITINEGLFVPEGSELHIYCQSYDIDKMGKLTADNSSEGTGAGIGCKDGNHPGTIIIHGGDIVAKGGSKAAGIGGGKGSLSGTIEIHGGHIDAKGGLNGAGIGGGEGGSGERIIIYGGTVIAEGSGDGAGIGGGSYDGGGGKSGHIEIWGGEISAHGDGGNGCYGAGIGGGAFPPNISNEIDDNYDINIYGGNIVAIGGGWYSSDEQSNATPEGGAAGIGGGRYSRPGSVEIHGGTIYAKGTYSKEQYSEFDQVSYVYHFDGRGIGSGGKGKVGTVIIWDGTITAVSYRGGKDSDGFLIEQGAFDKDGLTIDPKLKVKGGDNESSAIPANPDNLIEVIEMCAYNKWVKIEP